MTSVLREARDTNNVSISEIPAPAKLAPYSYALGAEVTADENFIAASGESIEELATGRIVVLFDPEAPEEWEGSFRIVSYIRAELEHELGNETMLGHVAWSWLEDALEANDCELLAAGGTTTRVLSGELRHLGHAAGDDRLGAARLVDPDHHGTGDDRRSPRGVDRPAVHRRRPPTAS